MFKYVYLLFFLVICGCSFPVAYFSSERDPVEDISKKSKFLIKYNEEQNISSRRYFSLIKNSLIENGFNIDENNSDYEIYYNIEISYKDVNTYRPYTSTESIVIESNKGSRIRNYSHTEYLPYNYKETYKTILITIIKNNVKNKVIVWEGRVSTDKELFDKNFKKAIDKLFNYFPNECNEKRILN